MADSQPTLPSEMKPKAMYRLTEGGWAAINRSHGWVLATFVVALLSLVAGIVSVVVALAANPSVEKDAPQAALPPALRPSLLR